MSELQQFKDASSMRQYSRQQRLAGKRIALVPTMVSLQDCDANPRLNNIQVTTFFCLQGYLHAGHLSLVQAAK